MARKAGRRYISFEVDLCVSEIDGSHTFGPAACWSQRGDQVTPLDALAVAESVDATLYEIMWIDLAPPPPPPPLPPPPRVPSPPASEDEYGD